MLGHAGRAQQSEGDAGWGIPSPAGHQAAEQRQKGRLLPEQALQPRRTLSSVALDLHQLNMHVQPTVVPAVMAVRPFQHLLLL